MTIVEPIVASPERSATDPPTRDGVEDQADGADLAQLVDELGRAAADQPDGAEPAPLAGGTFVFYPDGHGGLVMVMDVRTGVFPPGVHRGRIPPGMIRAVGVLASGGGKLAALKALTGGGRRGRG